MLRRDDPLVSALGLERRSVLVALGAGAVVSVSTVLLAATSAWLIVRAAERPSVLSLTVLMGFVQIFALTKAAGRYLERTLTHRCVLGAMARLRARVARDIEPLVPAGLGPSPAHAVDTVLSDVEHVQSMLVALAAPLAAALVAALVAIGAAGLAVPATALVLVGATVLLGAFVPVLASRLGARSEAEERAVLASLREEVDTGVMSRDDVVGVGGAAALLDRVATFDAALNSVRRRRAHRRSLVTFMAQGTTATTVVLCVLISVLAVAHGGVNKALVAVPALTAIAACELLNALSSPFMTLHGDLAALRRLSDLAHAKKPVDEPVTVTRDVAVANELYARDLAVSHGPTIVLGGVDLSLSPGDLLVIKGRSGAGKTTLSRVLARFLDPDHGAVQLGDAEFRELRSTQVRQRVGLVDDEPHVFSTTLAGNLRIAAPNATDEELRDALELAGLGPVLSTMPEGLETPIGGATSRLSGGERRRLGVARELLARRAIVILDEPTEGLDRDGARELMERLVATYADRALVVITHRDDVTSDLARFLELSDGVLT